MDKVERGIKEVFPLKVKPKVWSALDEKQKARHVQDLADSKTGQVDAKRLGDGSFSVQLNGIKQVSLMLPMHWIPESGKVNVTTGELSKSVRTRPSPKVLLLDFVERFDRNVLPVCEVVVKP